MQSGANHDRSCASSRIEGPYAKNQAALATVVDKTLIRSDLRVNSARMAEIVVKLEDAFGVDDTDDDADTVRTVGNAVDLIVRLKPKMAPAAP
jgi:acyl carrier protein